MHLTQVFLLAATEEPGLLAGFLASTWLWVKVALGIGFVIFVHELGHFLAAKSFGVKCEKFYVGFDPPIEIGPIKLPRTLGKFTYGETEYGIGILPLGGYVKMLGQDDDPRKAEEEAQRIRTAEAEGREPELDPRSYPAKPVWQRMVIISAGVVMNVITGILFAVIAYFNGVPYQPAVVGGVVPGGPAWQAGIEPGGQVIGINDLIEDDQMHFSAMRVSVLTAGMDAPDDPVNVRIAYGDEIRVYDLRTQADPDDADKRLIGIYPGFGNQLPPTVIAPPNTVAADIFDEDLADAVVTAMDGKSLDKDPAMAYAKITAQLVNHPSEPVDLTLTSTGKDGTSNTQTVTLPPQSAKSLGIEFEMGPVVALVKGGPAESAGIRVGDRIIAVGDQRDLHAFTLLTNPIISAEPVEVEIIRTTEKGDVTESLSVTPRIDSHDGDPTWNGIDRVAINSLGLAYVPQASIASTSESESELKVGDQIREVQFRFDPDEDTEVLKEFLGEDLLEKLSTGWEIGATLPVATLMETIQFLPTGTKVAVKATRPPEGTVMEVELKIQATEDHWYERGLFLMPIVKTQTATSVGEATALGLREGGRRMTDVLRFLKMLVTGRVKAKYIGGPVRIAQVAAMQTEQGFSTQLLFLTLLSMNLAILNFLPIPALDGGHMMFLTAEAIRGKRVDEQLEMRLTLVGVIALLALMVFVFANDLIHLGS
ncbi:MAG: site-2 protease family protein [Planctomycetota bacterium]